MAPPRMEGPPFVVSSVDRYIGGRTGELTVERCGLESAHGQVGGGQVGAEGGKDPAARWSSMSGDDRLRAVPWGRSRAAKRRELVGHLVAALSLAAVAGCAPTTSVVADVDAGSTTSAATTSVPTAVRPVWAGSGTLFGACVWENQGETYPEALARENEQFGPLEIIRVYLSDTDPLAAWSSPQLSSHVPMQVSFKGDPRVITGGARDAMYAAWFAAAPRDRDIYWTFFHEPDDNIARGEFSAAEYVAAWRHLKQLANRANNPRLHATLSLMNWSLYPESGRRWQDMYPGNDVIDVLAWDVNNLGSAAGRYEEPAALLTPVIAASTSVGKPWAVAEWGSALLGEDSGSERAEWMLRMGAFMRANNALYATYFNSTVGGESRLLDEPSMSAQRELSAAR